LKKELSMHLLVSALRRLIPALMIVCAVVAEGATITVTSLLDAVPAVDANCTLREAILAANTDLAVDSCAAGSGADTIVFSVTGTIAVMATAPLPSIITPVTIDGPGGGASIPQVRIDGNLVNTVATDDEWGFHLAAGSAGSTIRDMLITRFEDGGILVNSANNSILGNWVGTDGTSTGLGNGTGSGGGIRIQVAFTPTVTASANVIGGTTPADRNLVAGNNGAGISVNDYDTADGFTVTGTVIQGNYLGTNPAGTALSADGGGNGRAISAYSAINLNIGGTTGTTPGGSCTGACNLITGGYAALVDINADSAGPQINGLNVQGNHVGTNVSGTGAIGCSATSPSCMGFQIAYQVAGNIGGTTPNARNIISGLDGNGIYLFNTVPSTTLVAPFTIAGNYIGLNSAGTAVIANAGFGIQTNPSEGLTIGGATTASANFISGNGSDGIRIDGGNDLVTTGVTIQNNRIGVLADEVTAAGNGGAGVNLNNGVASMIDFATVQQNIIANNTGAGVSISSSGNNNRVLSNSIYNNGGLGIDQDQDGVVEINDNCDVDTLGANDLQNYPVITSATVSGGNLTVTGTLNSLASTQFTLQFFGNTTAGDEGRIFLGATTVNTTAGCTAAFSFGPVSTTLVAGNTITATATNNNAANPDTSEFSAAAAVVLVLNPPTVTKSFTPSSIAQGGTSTLTIQIQNPNAEALTNVSFTDTYPAQITTAAVPNITGNCGGGTVGSTSGTFTLSGGNIAGGGSCTVTIDVTSSTVGGPHMNSVTVTSNAPDGSGSAGLTVTALTAPTVTKSFAPASIATGGVSTLTIQITNPNPVPLSNVAFTDTYPAQITTAAVPNITGNCGGGTVGSTSGTFTLSGGSIAASGACSVSIDVTSSTPGGPYMNSVTVTSNAPDGNGSAGLTVTDLAAPNITKSFTPSTIASGGVSTLTIQIANPNGTALSNVSFTDTYPAQISTAAVPNITGNCGGGTVGSTAGTFTLSGGSIAATGSCTVTVDVTSSTPGGPYVNSVTVTSNAADGNGSAALTVLAPPGVAKLFSPDVLATGAVSTLTITLGNTNDSTITGVSLTDNFPANLVVATPNNLVNSCGGSVTATAGSGTVILSGGSIPNGGCSIGVSVTSATAGGYNNSIETTDVTSDAGSPVVGTFDIILFTAPLSATKGFAPSTIAPNGTATLTVTLTNPNSIAATDVAFTDTYPVAIMNAATPNAATTCSGGSLTATAGTSVLQVSGLTIPANSSCTVTVTVTSAIPGTHTNTIPAGGITSSNTGSPTTDASASLTVNAPPTVTKSFAPALIASGGTSTLTVTLTNPNAVALTGAAFTDTYPAEIVNATPAGAGTTCGGVVTAADGGGTLALSGGTIPANGSCTVTVAVTSSTAGAHVNTIPSGGVTVANAGASANPAMATLTVSDVEIPTFSSLTLLLLVIMVGIAGAFVLKS
jgi:CSLREA domain-containing protein/uncharacterized repeat protein (TIGR01451 family)